jgi:protein O-GlcNAc transferase
MSILKWFKGKSTSEPPAAAPAETPPPPPQTPRPQTPKSQGDEHAKAGRYAEAEGCYRQVTESDAQYPGALVMLGFVLKAQGRLDEARQALERAVVVAADDADAHYLLAGILESSGLREQEISHLQKAIELRPNFELARRQLIVALVKTGRLADATTLCEQSLVALPQSGELHYYRSNLYLQVDDKAGAIASCQRALALNPQLIPAQQSLSRLSVETGQLEQAEVSYRREIQLTPEHFGPYHMLGVVLHRMGRYAEAIEPLKRAIQLNPDSSGSYVSLGRTYLDSDESSEENRLLAQLNFEKAVALDPGNSECHCNLGLGYWRMAQPDRALASFDKAIETNTSAAIPRWARVMLWAPAFGSKSANDSPDRTGFALELTKFEQWWATSESDGSEFVGVLQPSFLTYQEENNRTLLEQYGRLCARTMQRWLERQEAPASIRPPGQRIRLGIVSADVHYHSNWLAILDGWFRSFDRERFELVVFSLFGHDDTETAQARAKSDVFFGGPKSLPQWVTALREQNCEILIYPAIGLDTMALRLASLRLAPVQINCWGHPDTSGLPTIDYYVSAECFEPADAQDYYSERLILLPNLGNRVQPLNLTHGKPDFAKLNIDLERPILVCPGTPYKYQAAYDHVFTDIARRLPTAQLVFFMRRGEALSDIFRARIVKLFEAAGLDVKHHVRFLSWLEPPDFHALLRRADVMLDTIGFSGYNTAAQAMECGLPLVTREGRFLRGRLASGVLRRMGLEELIVPTEADYVDLVIKLVTDRDYRAHIRHEIEQRRPVLFDDRSVMGPFQDFLASLAPRDTAALSA